MGPFLKGKKDQIVIYDQARVNGGSLLNTLTKDINQNDFSKRCKTVSFFFQNVIKTTFFLGQTSKILKHSQTFSNISDSQTFSNILKHLRFSNILKHSQTSQILKLSQTFSNILKHLRFSNILKHSQTSQIQLLLSLPSLSNFI